MIEFLADGGDTGRTYFCVSMTLLAFSALTLLVTLKVKRSR